MNRRVFLQPNRIITFLERVAPHLPEVAIHSSEHGSSHGSWTFAHAVGLMTRAEEVSSCHHRSWMYYTTGARVPFLSYDTVADGFPARPSTSPLVVGKAGKRGGVGFESRRDRRKRYRDLYAVSTDPGCPVPSLFFVAPSDDAYDFQEGGASTQAVLLVRPLDMVGQEPARAHAVRALILPQEELAAVSELTRALGAAIHRSWTVGGVISTLWAWPLARADEARGLRRDLDAQYAELQQLQRELTPMPGGVRTRV